MKPSILLLLATIFSGSIIFGQTNNSYDSTGRKVVSGLNLVYKNYLAGNLTAFSQTIVDHYADSLSLSSSVDEELMIDVYNTDCGGSSFDYNSYIDNSGLSTGAKSASKRLIAYTGLDITTQEFRDSVEAKVTEISHSSLSSAEKELLLKSAAAIYHLPEADNSNILARRPENGDLGYAIGAGVGIVVGGILGAPFGPIGIFAGSVFGGVIGAVIGHGITH